MTAKFLDLDEMDCYRNEIKKIKIEILAKEYSFRLHHKGFVIDRNCIERKLLDRARRNGRNSFWEMERSILNRPIRYTLKKEKLKEK